MSCQINNPISTFLLSLRGESKRQFFFSVGNPNLPKQTTPSRSHVSFLYSRHKYSRIPRDQSKSDQPNHLILFVLGWLDLPFFISRWTSPEKKSSKRGWLELHPTWTFSWNPNRKEVLPSHVLLFFQSVNNFFLTTELDLTAGFWYRLIQEAWTAALLYSDLSPWSKLLTRFSLSKLFFLGLCSQSFLMLKDNNKPKQRMDDGDADETNKWQWLVFVDAVWTKTWLELETLKV